MNGGSAVRCHSRPRAGGARWRRRCGVRRPSPARPGCLLSSHDLHHVCGYPAHCPCNAPPMSRLPLPDAVATAHSERLRQVIQEQIFAAGGAIPFSRFMELCLYAPGLGYYSAGATKFGPDGDFVTAPELGPLFAACGGGSGAFAEVALKRLLALDALPSRYAILEPSADLRLRQRERLQRRLNPLLFDLVEWLAAPVQDAWNGVLFANEVIDALPTPRFTVRNGD